VARLGVIPGIEIGPWSCAHSVRTTVADLAASGMTNRDIAATLCITIKTVEHNLSRVYAKLSIRSRAELGRRMDQLAAKQ
jgi:DNA-binding NarL/FixJ family response regulator